MIIWQYFVVFLAFVGFPMFMGWQIGFPKILSEDAHLITALSLLICVVMMLVGGVLKYYFGK